MDRYKENIKWLIRLAAFRDLSISAAYLFPFFLERGLGLSQIFLLQSIFSAGLLLWELPSGYLADKYGRALCLKLSMPLNTAALILYGFSNRFWQFALIELALAMAGGMKSGIDTALLHDSLRAGGREEDDEFKKEFVMLGQRMNAVSYASTAIGVPIAVVLVHFFNLRSTLVADGVLTSLGMLFALRLVEAPRFKGGETTSEEAVRLSAWHSVRELGRNVEARWLITLTTALGTATYFGFWLGAAYYAKLGIPVVWFGVILAVRSLWKAWLSHKFVLGKHLERSMVAYASLAGLVLAAMATGHVWLAFMVLGHDIVQALQSQRLIALLNEHMKHEFRATLNSLVNLIARLAYSVTGPLVGLLIDKRGLSTGLLATGMVCSVMAFIAIARLHKQGTFHT